MPFSENDLERVVLDSDTIQKRVSELADEISIHYAHRDLVLVTILRGGLIFLADLSRKLTISHTFDVIGASSYGALTKSSGHVLITKDVEINLENRDVLLVEDIYDTGHTLRAAHELIKVHDPRSVKICALLVKRVQRDCDVKIDYAGFEIDNDFVVGYGLDYNERYRHLNCIGILKSEIYEG